MDQINIDDIKQKLENFAQLRDWKGFHNPKNLAMALSVEASELLELFQWLTPEQANHFKTKQKERVEDELADILLYAIRLSSQLDINLSHAIAQKMKKNEEKYPLEKSLQIKKDLLEF